MRIYVASSWKNKRQPFVVGILRGAGHEVYDFRNPEEGNSGFSWKDCATDAQLADPRKFRDEVLAHPVARRGFVLDMEALKRADATVLVLPCGRSAHLELGYAVGATQWTFVLMDDVVDSPELMYRMVSKICIDPIELVTELRAIEDRGR